MIMLTADAPFDFSAVQSELTRYWPDLPPSREIADEGEEPSDESGNVLGLDFGESRVFVMKMPAPIPVQELEGPCTTSVLWPNASEEVSSHTAHWIVTVMAELDDVSMATLLTQVTAAVLAACPTSIGVYWGNSTMVIPKQLFLEFAREVLPEEVPLPIWVDFRVGQDSPQSSSGFTTGMRALGHMEFETQGAPEPPGELRDRFMGLAGYLIENGPIIQDGNTIGQVANEKIRVVYSDSLFGYEEQVMRLVYERESPGKPWWKFW